MTANLFTRRDFSVRLASVLSVLGVTGSALASGGSGRTARLAGSDETSHTAEAIHQEVGFKASRTRVYQALTETKQFDKVIQLGRAGMSFGKNHRDQPGSGRRLLALRRLYRGPADRDGARRAAGPGLA